MSLMNPSVVMHWIFSFVMVFTNHMADGVQKVRFAKPTPPWMKRGLYDFPGCVATPSAADFTN